MYYDHPHVVQSAYISILLCLKFIIENKWHESYYYYYISSRS